MLRTNEVNDWKTLFPSEKKMIEDYERVIREKQALLDMIEADADYKRTFDGRIDSIKQMIDFANQKIIMIYKNGLERMNPETLRNFSITQDIYDQIHEALKAEKIQIETEYERKLTDLKQSERYKNNDININDVGILEQICEYKQYEISEDGKLNIADACLLFFQNEELRDRVTFGLKDPELTAAITFAKRIYNTYINNIDQATKAGLINLLKNKNPKFYNLLCHFLQPNLEKMIFEELEKCQLPKSFDSILEQAKTKGVLTQFEAMEEIIEENRKIKNEEQILELEYKNKKRAAIKKSIDHQNSLMNPRNLKGEVIAYLEKQRNVHRPIGVKSQREESLLLRYLKEIRQDRNFINDVMYYFEQTSNALEQRESLVKCERTYKQWEEAYEREAVNASEILNRENKILNLEKEINDLEKQLEEKTKRFENEIGLSNKKKLSSNHFDLQEREINKPEKKDKEKEPISIKSIKSKIKNLLKLGKEKAYTKMQENKISKIRKFITRENALQEFGNENENSLELTWKYIKHGWDRLWMRLILPEDKKTIYSEYFKDKDRLEELILQRKDEICKEKIDRNLELGKSSKSTAKNDNKANTNVTSQDTKKVENIKDIFNDVWKSDSEDDVWKSDSEDDVWKLDSEPDNLSDTIQTLFENLHKANKILKNVNFEDEKMNESYQNAMGPIVKELLHTTSYTTEELNAWQEKIQTAFTSWDKNTKRELLSQDLQIQKKEQVDFIRKLFEAFQYDSKNTLPEKRSTLLAILELLKKFKNISNEENLSKMFPQEIESLQILCDDSVNYGGMGKTRVLPTTSGNSMGNRKIG